MKIYYPLMKEIESPKEEVRLSEEGIRNVKLPDGTVPNAVEIGKTLILILDGSKGCTDDDDLTIALKNLIMRATDLWTLEKWDDGMAFGDCGLVEAITNVLEEVNRRYKTMLRAK